MELIVLAGGDYQQYEDLLFQRDQLDKEAVLYEMAYRREFGELELKGYELRVDCIGLKKSIAYCQKMLNRGETIDEDKMKASVEMQMKAYRQQIAEMIRANKESESKGKVSAYQAREIKKIYRRIAKLIHPDINPLTKDDADLRDLFQRAITAYRCNSLKELRETEVLINRYLKEQGFERIETSIPNIEEKIRELLKGDAESQMYAVYSLINQNLRKHKVLVDDILSSDTISQAKDILIYALIEQEISEEFFLVKDGLEYHFVPRYCLLPEESDGYQEAVKELKEVYLHEPSLYQFALDLLQEKCFSHLPLSYEAEESGQLVDAIKSELAKMFGTVDNG